MRRSSSSTSASLVVTALKLLIRVLVRLRVFWIILIAALFLSGCVKYDVGVHYDSQNHGTLVQHVRLSDRLTSFSDAAQEWLRSVEQRTKQLGGRVKRVSDQELRVTIPFNNGADLEEKFNQFFQSQAEASVDDSTAELGLPELTSHLTLTESNLLLLERNRLSFDLDLRSLGVLSSKGNLLVSPGSLIDLEFSLDSPWGARSVNSSSEAVRQGKQLVWMLKPGEINHLEAIFWIPSPLGIGSVAIALFVISGSFVKSLLEPQPEISAVESAPEI
ncbi:DUF3153 domain-containing protein [Leptolyngbya sp. FACHB-541]|uniref:DUF3153 domain-containing protein n=1 Tax=Leptolyngbya sp. FACHB-541 TaxID=2692810 RepID=UPI0016871BFC|nr:DUF3153 domain-containing protein [Leptolyngbya sp. FACHB-541]MBD2001322.1 DUF3153 domain-containing protein [Leptolyngbya sp. FACHB-541]